MMMEQWRVIQDATPYEVSDFGHIRYREGFPPRRGSVSNIVKCWDDKNGRPITVLRLEGHQRRFRLNVLVYRAFVGELPEKFQIDHIDGDLHNCRATNLQLARRYLPEHLDTRLVGKKYGFWMVLRRDGKDKYGNAMWLCRCECGTERRVLVGDLRRGMSRNCGCKNADMRDASGEKNSCWRGGQKIPGSDPWIRGKMRTINLHSRKSGHSEIISSVEEVRALFEAADGKCAVCRSVPAAGKSLHLDHCHATGVARGFLCNHCNVSLGMVGDSASRLRKLAAYIEASRPMLAANGEFDVHNFRIADGKVRAS